MAAKLGKIECNLSLFFKFKLQTVRKCVSSFPDFFGSLASKVNNGHNNEEQQIFTQFYFLEEFHDAIKLFIKPHSYFHKYSFSQFSMHFYLKSNPFDFLAPSNQVIFKKKQLVCPIRFQK